MENIKTKAPIGLKIFATLYILKNTVPALIFSVAKISGIYLSSNFTYFLSSLSLSVGKMLQDELRYNQNNSLVTMSLIVTGIVFLVYLFFMTNNLRLENFRKNILLKVIRGLAVLNFVILVLKMSTGIAGYGTGEWNSGINVLVSLALLISFLLYVFISKELKNFFNK